MIVIGLVVITWGLPAWAMTEDPWLAMGCALLLFGLCAGVSAVVATLLGLSLLWVFLPLVLVGNVVALWWLFLHPPTDFGRNPIAGAVLAGVAALGMVPLKAPLLDWDTRTHWLGPARWYYGGGQFVRYALTNPAFAHRSYPPLVPASAGSMWLLQGHVDLRSGQVLTSLLNFGAVLVLGIGLVRLFPKFGPIPTIAAGLVVLSTYGIAGQYATDGYADLLWSACAVIAVIYLLLAPPSRVNFMVGAVGISVAGLTKVEGTVVAVALVLFACANHRRWFARAWPVVLSSVIVLTWPVYVKALGVPTDLKPEAVHSMVAGDDAIWRRLLPTVRSMRHATGGVIVVAVLCTLIGTVAAQPMRRVLKIGSSDWVWATAAVAFFAVGSAYVVSTDQLGLHLSSSVDRVTIVLRLLLLVDIAIWVVCAAFELVGDPPLPEDDVPEIDAMAGFGG